ncbi:hypothetical protein [Borrelia sp. RT1S]|uniref:hypothetical protein n=1 Tax=Borrelia sp. RT1S TaxID=2898580 RepID=UPI001E4549A0|nr:hypothetical protein [Borrelia sp. RT1S]UGQ17948.1 hypothetical protein LSO05_05810 [Borrelia sp. RT1S]
MGKKFLLILFVFCICLLTCRHDNKKSSSNNRKKETISRKTKLKNKKKKKLNEITVQKDEIETRKEEDEENEGEEDYDDEEEEDEKDGDAETNIAVVTDEKKTNSGTKGQQITPKKPIPIKVETIETEYADGESKTYYFKEHAMIDIKPTISHIKASLVISSGKSVSNLQNNEYPIIQDAKLTHIRILADKQELERMQIKNLDSLISSSWLETFLNNEGNILRIMLFSKGSNINEKIILPLNRRFIRDLEKVHTNSTFRPRYASKYMTDVLLGNDTKYTALDFSRFSNKNVGGSKLIIIQTEQNSNTSEHKLKLDPSIYTLLKDITTTGRLENLLK